MYIKRINKILSSVVISLTASFLLFHFFFIWMFEHGDSYYYLAFAEFLKTGVYPFQSPFIYQRPTTIAAPLYSLLIMAVSYLNRADIALHAVQLLMLAATAWLLYKMLKKYTGRTIAILVSCLYIFLPTNIIFVSYAMTEVPSLLGFTLFIYLMIEYIRRGNIQILSFLILLSAILTLLRYQFVILGAITCGIFLYSICRRKKVKLWHFLFPVTAFTILTGWIIYNHAITGVWGLSDTTKIRFHAAFVNFGHHFPKETDPAVIELRKYIPATADKYAAWWDIQQAILEKTGDQWHRVDEIVGNVGLAAIKEDPIGYLLNTGEIFIAMHTIQKTPWWQNIMFFGDQSEWAINQVGCRTYDSFNFCQPIVMTPKSYSLWDRFVSLSGMPYMKYFPLYALWILFPLLVINLIFGNLEERTLSSLYFITLLLPPPQSRRNPGTFTYITR